MAEANDNGREKLAEAYEESLFRLAVYDAAEQEGKERLLQRRKLNANPENRPSPEAEERFRRKLLSRLRKSGARGGKHPALRVLNKAAVCFLAAAAVFSTAMVTVKAFRVQVMNFLIDVQPEYTSFQIPGQSDGTSNPSDENLTVHWKNSYLPTYLPEGYEIDGFTYTGPVKEISYSSPDKRKILDYSESDGSVTTNLDTEGASVIKDVLIDGHKGKLVIKDEQVTIIWEIDRHVFTLCTQESEQESLKIARGVKFVQ